MTRPYQRASLAALLVVLLPLAASAAVPGVREYEKGKYPEAIKKLTPRAESGNAEAQYFLALSIKRELEFPMIRPLLTPKLQPVHGWMLRSAEQGYAAAESELAVYFEKGYGVPIDFGAALSWTQKAVEHGDSGARARMIKWLRAGYIVAPDPRRADELERADSSTSVPASSARAGFDLASYAKALDAAKDAVPSREAAAAFRRGAEDCEGGLESYQQAGDLGYVRGYRALGDALFLGERCPQNFARAYAAYLRGAAAGDTPSMLSAAQMEAFGHGIPVDYQSAYIHLRLYEEAESEVAVGLMRDLLDDAGRTSQFEFVRAKLSEQQRCDADGRIKAQTSEVQRLARRAQGKETAYTIIRGNDPRGLFSYELSQATQCGQNVLGQCRSERFLVELEVQNGAPLTLDCNVKLTGRRASAQEPQTADIRFIVHPSTVKRRYIAALNVDDAAEAQSVACRHVERPTVASGTCTVETPPGVAPEYPRAALTGSVQQGTVVLAVTLPASSGIPTAVELEKSSGSQLLDAAALDFARVTALRTNCPGERVSLPLRFAVR